MNQPTPVRITIESHGRTYMAELPWDADLTDVFTAMRGLLVSAEFDVESIDRYLNRPE